jgi:tetratricopeptide (TPR) repeat protein
MYLKARYLSQKASMPDIEKAISYLERVIELDAEYAPAYVVLADCYRAKVLLGDEAPSRAMPKAKAAAEKAVALNSSLAEAHAVLGWIRFWYEHDWQRAEAEFRKALSLELNNSDTHQYYAHLLSNTGRHEEAFEHIDAALKLEPLNLRANAFKAMFLQNAGNLNEAEQQFRSTLELEPDFRLAQMFLARTLGELERYEEALQLVNRIRERNPNAAEPISLDAFLLAKAGKRSEAQKILDELLDNASRRYISSYGIAQVQAALGDRPAALNSLERARLTNDLKLVFLKVDRSWDDLRSEPRFRDLLREIGLDR